MRMETKRAGFLYLKHLKCVVLQDANEFVVIQQKIKTSARLYEKHGVWTLQYHFWTIYIKKWFGATADELHAYYKKHIA